MLAHLSRTSISLSEHGENKHASWSPDSSRIVIEVMTYSTREAFADTMITLQDNRLTPHIGGCRVFDLPSPVPYSPTFDCCPPPFLTRSRGRPAATVCWPPVRGCHSHRRRNTQVPIASLVFSELFPNVYHSSVSLRNHSILFSTKNPPAVQRIPWPSQEEETEHGRGVKRKKWLGHDTWILNDQDFPWLRSTNGDAFRRHSRLLP